MKKEENKYLLQLLFSFPCMGTLGKEEAAVASNIESLSG